MSAFLSICKVLSDLSLTCLRPHHPPYCTQHHWPPCSVLNTETLFLPQGLCTHCPLSRNTYLSRSPHGWLLPIIQIRFKSQLRKAFLDPSLSRFIFFMASMANSKYLFKELCCKEKGEGSRGGRGRGESLPICKSPCVSDYSLTPLPWHNKSPGLNVGGWVACAAKLSHSSHGHPRSANPLPHKRVQPRSEPRFLETNNCSTPQSFKMVCYTAKAS